MLTEGWDANTVTHVLGIRAFGTQLLCEQVVGRALRRQSYELNADNTLNEATIVGYKIVSKKVMKEKNGWRTMVLLEYKIS